MADTELSVLQESPFVDRGTVNNLFENDIALFTSLRQVIESINYNAKAA